MCFPRILLAYCYMCPHTAICVCPHVAIYFFLVPRRPLLWQKSKAYARQKLMKAYARQQVLSSIVLLVQKYKYSVYFFY
jgi:hypothetical protein